MFQGIVKKWVAERGFGFIRADDEAQRGDVFAHVSNLPAGVNALEIGQRVSFDVQPDPRNSTRSRDQYQIGGVTMFGKKPASKPRHQLAAEFQSKLDTLVGDYRHDLDIRQVAAALEQRADWLRQHDALMRPIRV